jgi:tetratricopeptide (TPR) repeat protein
MSDIEWSSLFGWKEAELDDLRFVGFSYIKQGKWDIALSFFEALALLAPNQLFDLQTLGALYLQKGNHFIALNYIEKALKLDPKHEPTLLNKMKTLFALGFRKQGLAQAEELSKSRDPSISSNAQAFVLAYR